MLKLKSLKINQKNSLEQDALLMVCVINNIGREIKKT